MKPALTLWLCLIAAVTYAEVIRVPADYETIQAAIDNASRNDSILVSAGRYVEILTIDGLNLSLIGNPEEPSSVVIDGDGRGPVVTFTGDIRREALFSGFLITGGDNRQAGGGGLHCSGAGPTLRSLIVEDNVGGNGGGIYVADANPPIENVVIRDNESLSHGGGMTLMGDASPEMTNLTIESNAATSRGGGLASFSRGRPTLDQSRVWNNTANMHGGGIFSSGVIFLTDVYIVGNSCGQLGGGLYGNGDLSFIGGTLVDNRAASGGGAYLDGVRPSLERLLIAQCQAADWGGGLYLSGTPNGRCSPDILHVTFADNIAGETGGAIYCHDAGRPTLVNCILWDAANAEVSFDDEGDANAATVSYCDVQNGRDGVEINNNGDVTWGAGNIDRDPLFVNPDEGDYHLSWANYPDMDETRSPCIDAGHPDLDDDPDWTRADMGVYPFFQRHPVMEVEPLVLDFGRVYLGEAAELTFTVRNTGNYLLEGSFLYESPSRVFRVDDLVPGISVIFCIPPGEEWVAMVRFEPRERIQYNSTFELTPFFIEGAFVSFTGEGRNRFPVVSAPVDPVSLTEDADWAEIVDLDEVFTDPEEDTMTYTAFPPASISSMIDDENHLFLKPNIQNFNGRNLRLIVRADDGWAQSIQEMTPVLILITVLPLNDPPMTFHLHSPADGTRLPFHEARFGWSAARQNMWEQDEVHYALEIAYGERLKRYENLTDTTLTLDLAPALREIGYDHDATHTELIWRVIALDDSAQTVSDEEFHLWTPHPESVNEAQPLPTAFSFGPAFPNPFNSATTIELALPTAEWVTVEAYNLSGERVAALRDERMTPGFQRIVWGAGNLPAGVYILRCRYGDRTATARVALVK